MHHAWWHVRESWGAKIRIDASIIKLSQNSDLSDCWCWLYFFLYLSHYHPNNATCLSPWLVCLIYHWRSGPSVLYVLKSRSFFLANCPKWRKCPECLWLIYAGCHAASTEGSGSQSTASVTSTWFWSLTSRVQGISCAWAWRAQRLAGWAWAVTGVKIGSQTQCWLVSHCLLGSQAVTGAPPPHGTWSQPTGNLVKLLQAKISGSNENYYYFNILRKKKKFRIPAITYFQYYPYWRQFLDSCIFDLLGNVRVLD